MAEAQGHDVGPEMAEDLVTMSLETLKRIHKEMKAEEERAQLIAAIERSRRMRSEGTLTRRSLLNREENERLTALHTAITHELDIFRGETSIAVNLPQHTYQLVRFLEKLMWTINSTPDGHGYTNTWVKSFWPTDTTSLVKDEYIAHNHDHLVIMHDGVRSQAAETTSKTLAHFIYNAIKVRCKFGEEHSRTLEELYESIDVCASWRIIYRHMFVGVKGQNSLYGQVMSNALGAGKMRHANRLPLNILKEQTWLTARVQLAQHIYGPIDENLLAFHIVQSLAAEESHSANKAATRAVHKYGSAYKGYRPKGMAGDDTFNDTQLWVDLLQDIDSSSNQVTTAVAANRNHDTSKRQHSQKQQQGVSEQHEQSPKPETASGASYKQKLRPPAAQATVATHITNVSTATTRTPMSATTLQNSLLLTTTGSGPGAPKYKHNVEVTDDEAEEGGNADGTLGTYAQELEELTRKVDTKDNISDMMTKALSGTDITRLRDTFMVDTNKHHSS